jgi:hypothetical protein
MPRCKKVVHSTPSGLYNVVMLKPVTGTGKASKDEQSGSNLLLSTPTVPLQFLYNFFKVLRPWRMLSIQNHLHR